MVNQSLLQYTHFIGPEPWDALVEVAAELGPRVHDPNDAKVIIWFGRDPKEIVGKWSQQLRWIQLPDAGIEKWLVPEILDASFVATSAAGAYGAQVAEHALALILSGYHEIPRSFASNTWNPAALRVRSVQGARALIIGAGGIGLELASRLNALGVAVVFATREGRDVQTSESIPYREIASKLGQFDIVVLACPSTDETRQMVNREFLDAMRSDALLINIARGDLVDTSALVQALQESRIGFAGLDVTDPEPLPDEHELFHLENCVVTPHVANPPELKRRSFVDFVGANIQRFKNGEELKGQITGNKGY